MSADVVTLQQRPPTPAERFQCLADAMTRVCGQSDHVAAAIQTEMAADRLDVARAADAVGVSAGRLSIAYLDALLRRGFVHMARWGR